jgi:hypothetical protein
MNLTKNLKPVLSKSFVRTSGLKPSIETEFIVNLKLNDKTGTWVQVNSPNIYVENGNKYFIGYQSDNFGFQKEVKYQLHPSQKQ